MATTVLPVASPTLASDMQNPVPVLPICPPAAYCHAGCAHVGPASSTTSEIAQ